MFTALWALLRPALVWIGKNVVGAAFSILFRKLAAFASVAILLVAFFEDSANVVKTALQKIGQAMGIFHAGPDAIFTPQWSALGDALQIMNTFFPLDEAFQMATATLTLWTAVLIIRGAFFLRRVVMP